MKSLPGGLRGFCPALAAGIRPQPESTRKSPAASPRPVSTLTGFFWKCIRTYGYYYHY